MNPEESPAIVLNSHVVTLHSGGNGDDYELAIWLPVQM